MDGSFDIYKLYVLAIHMSIKNLYMRAQLGY